MRRTFSFHRQTMLLAVACLLGVTLGAGDVWGQEIVEFMRVVEEGAIPEDDSWNGSNRTIVVLRSTGALDLSATSVVR